VIYHYTSVNALALILSNRSILLNNLSRVDDATEGITRDLGSLMKYVFVSSWTREDDENIALWSMYTPNMAGVRIGLPADFLEWRYDDDGFVQNLKGNVRNTHLVFAPLRTIPVDVSYVPDDDVPFTIMEAKTTNFQTLWNTYLPELGSRKSNLWSFQREARFILFAVPVKAVERVSDTAFGDAVVALLKRPKTELNGIEVALHENQLNQMDITIGPNTGSQQSHERIVKALIEKYIPNHEGKVRMSRVKVRNR